MFEINLKIEEENELYNKFDESRRTLDREVADYLSEQFGKKEAGDEILLKIKCGGEVKRERVTAAFSELIREQELKVKNQKRINLFKQLWLFGIGVAFVTAAILLEGIVGSVEVELVSIVGSFAVWEAANIWIVENPKNRLASRIIKRLKSTKIVIEARD